MLITQYSFPYYQFLLGILLSIQLLNKTDSFLANIQKIKIKFIAYWMHQHKEYLQIFAFIRRKEISSYAKWKPLS